MSTFSPLQITIGIWALVTIIYIALFVYRAIIGSREEDSLFLSAGESHMAAEQRQIMQRVNKVDPATRAFGIAAAAMTVIVIGVWAYTAFRELF
jgi:formate hydrogenlyase subunit 3/multisubunit Na+/H+ antiporter MnhD subunit